MAGIPKIHRVVRHRIRAFGVSRPQRLDREAKIQELQQVMRAGKSNARLKSAAL